jgi:hypothetical protein
MPTPNNDVLPVETRASAVAVHSACPEVERIDPNEWPALGESVSPVARRPTRDSPTTRTAFDPADVSMPNEPIGNKTMADEQDTKIEAEVCLSPEPRILESKESLLRPLADPAATYLSRDPNPTATTYPGFLPPPVRRSPGAIVALPFVQATR